MINVNNNFNVIPWYSALEQQNHRKWYAFDKQWPLIMPNTRFLPFQFVVPSAPDSISAITVHSEDGNVTRNLGITPVAIPNIEKGYCVIMLYSGQCDFGAVLPVGRYYATLTIDGTTLYSEVFTAVDDISRYLKVTYWNTDTLYYKNGEINYGNDFQYEMYLDSTVGKPEYEFSEELTTRLGYKFLESQISNKLYKFTFLAPEFICDAMRLIRLSDYIKIEGSHDSYNAISFSYEPSWETQGDLAAVEVSFETDTIIQKLPSFNRNQRENFYNALLSSTAEPLLYDEGVVAQYYTAFSDAITGKLTRQLAEANVEEITENTVIPIDQGLGAAQQVKLLPLLQRYATKAGRDYSDLESMVSTHVSNGDIHITAEERKLWTAQSSFWDRVNAGTEEAPVYCLTPKPYAVGAEQLIDVGIQSKKYLVGATEVTEVDDGTNKYIRVAGNLVIDGYISFGGPGDSGENAGVTSLEALIDVGIGKVTPLKDGHSLVYDETLDLWVNKAATGLDETALKSYLTNNKYATQDYVSTQIANLVGSAPETLDTIYEIADQIQKNVGVLDVLTQSITTNTNNIKDLTERMVNLEKMWFFDPDNEDSIRTAYNVIIEKAISFGGVGTPSENPRASYLNNLLDVSAESPNVDDVLAWDGTYWVNKKITTGFDIDAMWTALSAVDSSRIIDLSHIPDLSSKYLSLSGGTISGTETSPLNINTTATNEVGLRLNMSGSAKAWVGYTPNLGVYLYAYGDGNGTHKLGVTDAGVGFLDSNTLLHSGNIGSYNAGSATKLQDNATYTAWGQTFFENGVPKKVTGPATFDNYISLPNNSGVYFKDTTGTIRAQVYANPNDNSVSFGYGTTQTGGNTYLYGTNILFCTGSNRDERMRILANGNVSIGYAGDGGAKLYVAGKGRFTDTLTIGTILIAEKTQNSTKYLEIDGDLVVTGAISFGGVGESTSSGGGINIDGLWQELTTPNTSRIIDVTHIPDLSGKYLSLSGGKTIAGNFTLADGVNILNSKGYGIFVYDAANVVVGVGTIGAKTKIRSNDSPLIHEKNGVDYTILDASNYTSYALPISGGTINSTMSTPLTLNSTNSLNRSLLFFNVNGTTEAQIGYTGGQYGVWMYNFNGGGYLGITDDGIPYYNMNTLIHAGNIGSYNAGSATKLQTARTIWGQRFDGTGNVDGGITIRRTWDTGLYNEGIRVVGESNEWCGVFLGTADATSNVQSTQWNILKTDVDSFRIGRGQSLISFLEISNSGNVLIGTTEDVRGRLQVSGSGSVICADSDTTNCWQYFKLSGVNKASVGYYNNFAFIANEGTYARIGITDAGVPQFWTDAAGAARKVYNLLHTGNVAPSLSAGAGNNTKITVGGVSSEYKIAYAQDCYDAQWAVSAGKLYGSGYTGINLGSSTQPVYFSSGVPVACTSYADATVGSATKLADNTAFTAWGQKFFENGVPKNVNGSITSNVSQSEYSTIYTIHHNAFTGLCPDIESGHNLAISVGKSKSTYNEGYFSYHHVANGSTDNYVRLGLFSADDILNITAAKRVGINTTTPQYTFDVVGTGRFTDNITCDKSLILSQATSNASKNYISAGGGYSPLSGKYGVKIVVCDQSDAQTGLGQDCFGSSYELSVVTTRKGNNGRISFGYHYVDSTTYYQCGYFDVFGNIVATGAITFGSSASDMRLKDVTSRDYDAVSILRGLSTFKYRWNSTAKGLTDNFANDNDEHFGLSAQELQKVSNYLVSNFDYGSGKEYLVLRKEEIVPLLVQAVKQLLDRIERVENNGSKQ